jgi:ribA/ribD-fused uncharacterized protein
MTTGLISSTCQMEVYTDGSRIPGFDGSGYSGLGLWFAENSPKNASTQIIVSEPTNQLAELMAIDLALRYCRYVADLIIKTDSAYSINSITVWYKSWEKNGWRTHKGASVMHSEVIQSIRRSIQEREEARYKTAIVHVKAHSRILGNEGADRLAYAASKKLEHLSLSKVHFFERGPLSNFFPSVFTSDYANRDITYVCTEQFYQYHKAVYFEDENMASKILESSSPFMHKYLGGKVSNYSSSKWDIIKEDIMLVGLRCKYTQNEFLRGFLVSIQATKIVEAREDNEWGIGITVADALVGTRWKGKNLLGNLLMKVRQELMTR